MAITTFVDPFGSMVSGYQAGQQTELQLQQGKRMSRDSDYEYQNRLEMDPLRKQYLQANVNQVLLANLMNRDRHPVELNILKEDAAKREMENFIAAATKNAKIQAANMEPQMNQSILDYRGAQTTGIDLGNEATRFTNEFSRFLMDPMMNDPAVGVPMFTTRLINQGMDPAIAPVVARSMFQSRGANTQSSQPPTTSGSVNLPATASGVLPGVENQIVGAIGREAWDSLPPADKYQMAIDSIAKGSAYVPPSVYGDVAMPASMPAASGPDARTRVDLFSANPAPPAGVAPTGVTPAGMIPAPAAPAQTAPVPDARAGVNLGESAPTAPVQTAPASSAVPAAVPQGSPQSRFQKGSQAAAPAAPAPSATAPAPAPAPTTNILSDALRNRAAMDGLIGLSLRGGSGSKYAGMPIPSEALGAAIRTQPGTKYDKIFKEAFGIEPDVVRQAYARELLKVPTTPQRFPSTPYEIPAELPAGY